MKKQRSQNHNSLHHAGWVIVDSETIIPNGWILLENGRIKGVYSSRPKDAAPQSFTDHGPGVLMPPLVNAHLHLELSALKGCLPMNKGFQHWITELLKKREALGEDALKKGAKKAISELESQGKLYIGEISTLGITKTLLENSDLSGIFFREFPGETIPEKLEIKKSPGFSNSLAISLAGHAPHTTSPQLLQLLKQQSLKHGLPFSIHVAESEAEMEFMDKKKGDWADLLTLRGINYKNWEIGGLSPVAYLNKLKILDRKTLTVHLLHLTDNDINIIKNSGTQICVCPTSNYRLHGKLPDLTKMIKNGLEPALGTDSLASVDSLDIREEMKFTVRHYPELRPESIFNMTTKNGAKALGLELLTGTLEPGKKADFIYLPVNAGNKKELIRAIVNG